MAAKKMLSKNIQGRMSYKLILLTILFSSILTLLLTLTQLYFEYRRDVNSLNENIKNVETGYRQGITNALWLDDKKQLVSILDGANALPNIEYIEVREKSKLFAASGNRVTKNIIEHTFPLHYEHDNKTLTIGEVFVEADLTGIYQKILNHFWILLGSNAIKTFIVAIFMYFLFDHLVFRRLKKIFGFIRNLDIGNLNKRINIADINKHNQPDEISELANALNKMLEQSSRSVNELLRLKTTLDLSLDGIVMFYPDNYKFFYANTGLSKMLGYSVEELLNMTPIDICPDFNNTYVKRLIPKKPDNEEHASQFETAFKHKNGKTIPVRIILQYLSPKNEEPRFAFIARDITESKADDMMLLKSLEEAKSSNEAKSKFMMSMSHELRTPLNAILGFSQLLELDSSTLTKEQNSSVQDILLGGRHLQKLIEELLDLSKIESDNISLSLELKDPTNLLDECIKFVLPMAVMKNIKLEDKTTGVALPQINIDHTRFRQVITNLLTNAIKYNDNNGTVTLSCELLPGNIIRFKVSDNGYGIKESEQPHVFIPFNRLGYEGGTIEGTGIGLNITKRLVELMDGEIDFISRHKEGSEFWVDFPYPIATSPQESKTA